MLVAAVSAWHEDHDHCRRALDAVLEAPPVIVPQHVLIESYSVLTRLPAPRRFSPHVALDLLERTLQEAAELVALPSDVTWQLVRDLRDAGVAGGAVYDAVILHSAAASNAERILTLNTRHFERLAPPGLQVVAP